MPHLSVESIRSVTLIQDMMMIIVTGPAAARTDNYSEAGPLSAAVTMVAAVQHAKKYPAQGRRRNDLSSHPFSRPFILCGHKARLNHH